MTAYQENRSQVEVGQLVPDGNSGAMLYMADVPSSNFAVAFAHGLGRVPSKAHVVACTGRVINCYVAFKDAEKIHLVFDAAPGTALVRMS